MSLRRVCPDTSGWICAVACILVAVATGAVSSAQDAFVASDSVSFNRRIRPLLARHCWKCHGPDSAERQAGLRLDDRAAAMSVLPSGAVAIAPMDPERSELLHRVAATDPVLRMPPPEAGDGLTVQETALLQRWIKSGAPFEQHWAFQPLTRPQVPVNVAAPPAWQRNPIDAFVWSSLSGQQKTPSERADDRTLIRRVWFDLTGMPPTEQELQQTAGRTWEQIVAGLLQSPHFGERMAVEWLDMARYADTDGYFGDKPRQIWLYRDWLIHAFNRNVPYDQFTVEQLAGDLLPEATVEQRIATGFNRNHMSNDETGLIDEEYRLEYVADRTDTTLSVWLGLTAGCARCHDHKYDPLTQREYYQLSAFFNNVPERGLLTGSNAPPVLSVPSPEQQQKLVQLQEAAAAAERVWEPLREATRVQVLQQIAASAELPAVPHVAGALAVSMDAATDGGVRSVGTKVQPVRGIVGQAVRLDGTQHLEHTGDSLTPDDPWTATVWLQPEKSLNGIWSKIQPTGERRGVEVIWRKGRVLVNLVHRWNDSAIEVAAREKSLSAGWQHLAIRYDGSGRAGGVAIWLNGRRIPLEVQRDTLSGTISTAEPLRIGRRDEGLGFYGLLDEFHWLPVALTDDQLAEWSRQERLRGILARPVAERSQADLDWLLDDWIDRQGPDEVRRTRMAARNASTAVAKLQDEIPVTLVMAERSAAEGRRPTFVLERGEYQRPGEQVEPGVPAMLGGWHADLPANRLGLARWLTTGASQLTARVAVNRLWQQCFGAGLVRTPADFGTQGDPPTHPELLEWLASEYRDGGWDTKHMLQLIATSETYRQSSVIRQSKATGADSWDPENRWWSRAGRFRLSHEMLRDSRLRASGLLQTQIGGPSVKPWQPPGLWEEVSYDGESTWETDSGTGRFRRSLYTFQKRQAPPPALLLFDGPTREKCTLLRARTNTPLQALQLLNDPESLQAARSIAERVLLEGSDVERIGRVFRIVLTRDARDEEVPLVMGQLAQWRAMYSADLEATADLLAASRTEGAASTGGTAESGISESGTSESGISESGAAETAAWTVLVHSLFCLDEAVNRR